MRLGGMSLAMGVRQLLGAGGAALSTLITDLVSAWPLSADGSDAHGANDLTNNNGVTFVPLGPSGVVSFIDGQLASESLTVTDNPSISLGADSAFMVAAWVRPGPSGVGANDMVIGKWGGAGVLEDQEYVLYYNAGAFSFGVANGVSGATATSATGAVAGQWYFVVGWHDPVANLIKLRVNETEFSAAWAGGTQDGDGTLAFGKAGSFGSYALYANVARAGLWIGSTDDSVRTSLYNAGRGKSYANLTTAEKVNLVSYWDLDEASGNRADSHGSNTLTDNNTVGSFITGPSGVVASFVAADVDSLTNAAIPIADINSWSAAFWYKSTNAGMPFALSNLVNTGAYAFTSAGTFFYGTPGVNLAALVNDGLWHFVLLQQDSGTSYEYLDGVLIDSEANVPNAAATLALALSVSGFSIDGQVANVGIWDGAKAGDVVTLFNGGRGKRYADLTAGEKTGLISYYDLNEISGTRADAHASNDLTDNNTVGYTFNSYPDNMPGTVANFADAGDALFEGGIASPGVDFSVAIWVKSSNTDGDRNIITLGNTWPNDIQFSARNGGTGTGGVNVLVGSGAGFVQGINPNLTIHDGAWHLLVFTFTDADGLIRTYVDNVQGDDSSVLGAPHYSASSVLALGLRASLSDYIGNQSSALMAGRVWTPTERATIWNGGAGGFFPFTGLP